MTFGAGSIQIERAAKRLYSQANRSGFFAKSELILSRDLKDKYPAFFESKFDFIKKYPKGYGLWIWKPFLVREQLVSLNEGEGLLYLDAGCQFNFTTKSAVDRFEKILEQAETNSGLFFQLPSTLENKYLYSEKYWSKKALFDLIPGANKHMNSGQIQGGLLFLINNAKTRALLDDWIYWCERNESELLLDTQQSNDLIEHRNDQSILSLLLKVNSFSVVPDETYWAPNWKIDGKNYPIWALRNKTGITKYQFKLTEIPDYLLSFIMKFKFGFNFLIKKLKKICN